MELNMKIPGQMSEKELTRLSELASRVPAGGIIVEVGSLYGLSSWHLAKHSKPDVTVFCIDPWVREQWIVDLVEGPQLAAPFCKAVFQRMTRDVTDKIVCVEGYSPRDVKGWKVPIDLYVEDAVHENPILAENIDFWSTKIKRGGVACGHDYGAQFPDVKREVDKLAAKYNSSVSVEETLWSVEV